MMFLFWTSDRQMQVSSIGGNAVVGSSAKDWGDDRRTVPWRLPLVGVPAACTSKEQELVPVMANFGQFGIYLPLHFGAHASRCRVRLAVSFYEYWRLGS
jgi:hypothetical protein